MDGNGRWASMRGEERSYGHIKGANSIDEILQACLFKGVPFLTLYAFSTENNKRPEQEVNALMDLSIEMVNTNIEKLMNNNVRIKVIGDFGRMKPEVVAKYQWCMEKTKNNNKLTLILAFNYSSRNEIVRATKNILLEYKNNIITENDIDERFISQHLDTKDFPDPDMIIRTGGELRLSNFLLWQASYSELYFTDVLWPDFKKENLFEAIDEYMNRDRRFGLVNCNTKKNEI